MPLLRTLLRRPYRALVRVSEGLLEVFFVLLRLVLPRDRYYRARAVTAERACTEYDIGGIRFHVNHPVGYLRARNFRAAEPDLIAWIDDFVDENAVFYDIGACIGAYSLYGAKKGARVIAFEPCAANYDLLNRNIWLNGLGERIAAFNLAAHDKTEVASLNLSKMNPGGAIHAVNSSQGGSQYDEFDVVHEQSVVAIRLDDFVNTFGQPFPTHVKIDVDGNDPLVLAGMAGLLDDQRLWSISIEINPEFRDRDRGVHDVLAAKEFEQLTEPRYVNPSVSVSAKAYNAYFVRRG